MRSGFLCWALVAVQMIQQIQPVASEAVKIAVLLPFDDDRLFSMKRVAPAIDLAIHSLNETDLLRENLFEVSYGDSKCNIAEGINKAIGFYIAKQVHVFLGPVCDFAVAPVARQVGFWNLPIISTGAMARDFALYHKSQYHLLTRLGAVNFQSLFHMLQSLLARFRWSKLKLLYDKVGQDYIVKGLCHLEMESLHYALKNANVSNDYYKVDHDAITGDMLKKELGLDEASRWRCER